MGDWIKPVPLFLVTVGLGTVTKNKGFEKKYIYPQKRVKARKQKFFSLQVPQG